MKKRNLKSLKLNKKSVSNLTDTKGGNAEIDVSGTVIYCVTTWSCRLICVTWVCKD